ncbi:MAG: hypothetical protein FJ053_01220 [Cyanobacteria bacterium M_surface_10_m1_298]|nr:hypothetical protein [Cyanobacteria bacterium M_surface_10_m1_298]
MEMGSRRWLQAVQRLLLCLVLSTALLVGWPAEASNPSAPAVPVEVALNVDNVYGFSSQSKTYNIEGILHLSAPEPVMRTWLEAGIDPVSLIRFQNQVTPWDAQLEAIRSPIRHGPRLERSYRFHGTFYSDEIDFRGYPFDPLPLQLTLQPSPSVQAELTPPPSIVLRPDAKHSGVSTRSNMNGYRLLQWRLFSTASGLEMELIYRPIVWSALVKWLLPLAITMSVMLLSSNLRSSFSSERLAIPPVILLTLVFMQQAYRESLPSLPYLTEIDGLYAFSYLVTLVFFCEFIWCANLISRSGDALPQQVGRQIDRLENVLQLASIAGYSTLLCWALASR